MLAYANLCEANKAFWQATQQTAQNAGSYARLGVTYTLPRTLAHIVIRAELRQCHECVGKLGSAERTSACYHLWSLASRHSFVLSVCPAGLEPAFVQQTPVFRKFEMLVHGI